MTLKTEQFCTELHRAGTNTNVHGCLRAEGHDGPHVNEADMIWLGEREAFGWQEWHHLNNPSVGKVLQFPSEVPQ